MNMTFPRLLLEHARQRPNEHALREKEYGIWQTWSWQRAADEVRWMACGLTSLGFKAGNNLAIAGTLADAKMNGTVALASQTLDLYVVVQPKLDLSTAALAVGVINPLAGVGRAIRRRIL